MSNDQIRINELARELEIKAKVLIEYLPQIGVTEKKTHSSPLDREHAEKVRKHFHSLVPCVIPATNDRTHLDSKGTELITSTRSNASPQTLQIHASHPHVGSKTLDRLPAARVSLTRSDAPRPTSAQDARAASRQWAAALGDVRRLITDVLDEIEPRRPPETCGSRISRLSFEKQIPAHVAGLLQALIRFRNAAEYNSGFVPSSHQAGAIAAMWKAIIEWATTQQSKYVKEMASWDVPR